MNAALGARGLFSSFSSTFISFSSLSSSSSCPPPLPPHAPMESPLDPPLSRMKMDGLNSLERVNNIHYNYMSYMLQLPHLLPEGYLSGWVASFSQNIDLVAAIRFFPFHFVFLVEVVYLYSVADPSWHVLFY